MAAWRSGGFVAELPQPPAIGGQPFGLRVRSQPVPGVSSRGLLNPRLLAGSPSGWGCDRDRFRRFRRRASQPPAIGWQPFGLRVRSRPVPAVSSRTLLNPRLRKGSPSGCSCKQPFGLLMQSALRAADANGPSGSWCKPPFDIGCRFCFTPKACASSRRGVEEAWRRHPRLRRCEACQPEGLSVWLSPTAWLLPDVAFVALDAVFVEQRAHFVHEAH